MLFAEDRNYFINVSILWGVGQRSLLWLKPWHFNHHKLEYNAYAYILKL